MINNKIKSSFKNIPFKSSLSFEYLIAEIQKIADEPDHLMHHAAQSILQDIANVPALQKSLSDFRIVEKHRELINRLMQFVFNPLEDKTVMAAAGIPFHAKSFYCTSLFKENFRADHFKFELANDHEENNMLLATLYQAFIAILIKYHNLDFDFQVPFTFKVTDKKNKSVKYYKLLLNANYTDIKVHGTVNKLSPQEIHDLLDCTEDLDYWNSKIPLEKFEFSGFTHFTYIDVTQEFVISQLKSDLLNKDTIISHAGFMRLQEKVRALMGIPDMEFGMAAFGDLESSMNQNVIWKSILPQAELPCDEYIGTLYETAYLERKIILTDDLQKLKRDKMVIAFLQQGIRNHAIVPLVLEDEIVGMLEFGAWHPGQISMLQIKRLHELFPVFAIALKRSNEELTDRLRAIIQEKYTAIHPTVEWRFYEAAEQTLENELQNNSKTPVPIIFPDVVPIYGATDIRNSSVERNIAIQTDLGENLIMAKNILEHGIADKEMPLLDYLSHRIDDHLETVNAGLKAGDEVSILEFLKKDVEPVFRQLKKRDASIAQHIEDYFKEMDPELQVLYKKRKEYEDSISRINHCISDILDEEQIKAQQIFPHYFEKYRTDGVEYNAYIGQSLVKDRQFDQIYLGNIRLWQLLVKVKIARAIEKLKPSLKVKLDVTQLILVHSNPLSISFRHDEKKFDVAGAYNIRYEITKKRIDKAHIKDSRERITHVGKIAIIYSHAEEIEEFRKYIDFLIAQDYLLHTVEDFELEDLKGASGLRALRVEVNFGQSNLKNIDITQLQKVIQNN